MHTVERDWRAHGLRCVVLAIDMGHRCGYVGVPESHPLFGVAYNESHKSTAGLWAKAQDGPIGRRGIVPVFCSIHSEEDLPSLDVIFDVHGSLTYSRGSIDYPVNTNGLWWFGFDCAHHLDGKDPTIMSDSFRKIHSRYTPFSDGIVRDTAYVVRECERLAEQLATVNDMKAPD